VTTLAQRLNVRCFVVLNLLVYMMRLQLSVRPASLACQLQVLPRTPRIPVRR
jgi:hypothetical protein